MENIAGQVALVTGGGTGIGKAVALGLMGEDARVVVCGRRLEPLNETAELIRNGGGEALAVQADVSLDGDVDHLMRVVRKTYGEVDILVNNAGIGGGGFIHKHDIETWDQTMAVNLGGPFLMARAVLPSMRSKRRGHIVNISSESGLEYYQGNGAYGVAKHALNALGEFIQRENQDVGIRVDTICPGMVITEMTEDIPGLDHTKCLKAEEIADLVLWLVTRQPNLKIGRPILIQTMENPWSK